MDSKYEPAYASQLNDLMNVSPNRDVYRRIASLVERADFSTAPNGTLRIDAALFLVLNMGAMIAIPWQKAQSQDFFASYSQELEADVMDIVGEAKQAAAQMKVRQISANLLLGVTATRRGGTRTRGLNIWGP